VKSLEEVRRALSEHKQGLKEGFKIKEIGIFGSYARNEQREDSDVDILVEFEEPIGLQFVDLAELLENILEMKVDLVSRGAIKPNRWKYVEQDLIYV
jgi:predicted nucleotidyltransferase